MAHFILASVLLGELTFYNPGVMDDVYANRLRWQHVAPCAECVGMVALLDSENVGKRVWLSVDDGTSWVGPLLVVDCAGARDLARLRRKGRIAELSYELWQALGLPRRPVPGRVRFSAPNPGRAMPREVE